MSDRPTSLDRAEMKLRALRDHDRRLQQQQQQPFTPGTAHTSLMGKSITSEASIYLIKLQNTYLHYFDGEMPLHFIRLRLSAESS